MKGVAGLKPKPEKPGPVGRKIAGSERGEGEVRREVLAQQKQRRVEAGQRAVREAVNAKVESTRHFHVYANMMKTWRYWDQNWDALRDATTDTSGNSTRLRARDGPGDHEHPRRRGRRARTRWTTRRGARGDRRGLAAIGGGAVAPGGEHRQSLRRGRRRRRRPESRAHGAGHDAAPSPFRQSRQERLAEAKRRQAAAKEAASEERDSGRGDGRRSRRGRRV